MSQPREAAFTVSSCKSGVTGAPLSAQVHRVFVKMPHPRTTGLHVQKGGIHGLSLCEGNTELMEEWTPQCAPLSRRRFRQGPRRGPGAWDGLPGGGQRHVPLLHLHVGEAFQAKQLSMVDWGISDGSFEFKVALTILAYHISRDRLAMVLILLRPQRFLQQVTDRCIFYHMTAVPLPH